MASRMMSSIVSSTLWMKQALPCGYSYCDGDVAVEIFRDCDFGRERAPTLRHFDVLLLEDNLAAVVIDFRCAAFPFDLIERRNGSVAEHALKTQAGIFGFFGLDLAALGWFRRSFERGRRNPGFKLNHGGDSG